MKFADLRETIEKLELVDAHAHNIVALDSSFRFISSLTEASGDALPFAPHSLSFKRNLREIAELYGTEVSLEAVEEFRRSSGLEFIASKCFKAAGISAVLIDDGLKLDKMQEIEWHRTHVPFVGRVLRIEYLAEKILEEDKPNGSSWTLDSFTTTFTRRLNSLASEIVALKTIAAYRSGLDIDTNVTMIDAEEGLAEDLQEGKPVRITNKNFINYLIKCSLMFAQDFDLPLQIHTGFGDKDLDLRLSNPLHLRTLLEDERFSECRIVLLHASYPFSKEASYLASVYGQVYLDFGLAIPKLSVHGMTSSIKEILELAPIKKVMFSTDGYASPETYYLGAKKSREVVFSVLCNACTDGDITVSEAMEAAVDIFSRNATQFYRIDFSAYSLDSRENACLSSSMMQCSTLSNGVSFVRVIWTDASGQNRCRVVPEKRFNDVVVKNGVGLTFASMGMPSYTDGPADESKLTGVGEIRLFPDLSTRCRVPWAKQEEMVLADMHLTPGEVWKYCPREALRRVLKILREEFDLVLNAGFEIEFYLLKAAIKDAKEEWLPFDASPYCSTSGYDAAMPIFHEIFLALQSLNIDVEQFHPESGKGQFEIALSHSASASAADNLIFTREVIRGIARKYGLLATFLPKYTLNDVGSGCHVHLSLWKKGENVFMASDGSSRYGMSRYGEAFMAGVLLHLPSLLAIIAPLPNSYDRIQPNTWSGAYRCWGKENREAPLRTACPPGISGGFVSNFEIKSFDGCANPHLGLAAIAAAGIDGLQKNLRLPEPIDSNPFDVGHTLERLPKSLQESLEALQKDEVLHNLLGEKLVVAIRGVRKAEIDYYSKNPEAYKQLIYRY